jgi:hypothetical protein
MACVCQEFLFSHKEELNYVVCRKMDGTRGHFVKQSKSESKWQIIHVFSYKQNLIYCQFWYLILGLCTGVGRHSITSVTPASMSHFLEKKHENGRGTIWEEEGDHEEERGWWMVNMIEVCHMHIWQCYIETHCFV